MIDNMLLKIMLAEIVSNVIYKGYKEDCKFCWKLFYKKGELK